MGKKSRRFEVRIVLKDDPLYIPCPNCVITQVNETTVAVNADELCPVCLGYGYVARPAELKPDEFVNHPRHYNMGNIEVIDAIEDWKLGFHLGNAVKYIARADHKGKRAEDLEKAKFYLDREIERIKNA